MPAEHDLTPRQIELLRTVEQACSRFPGSDVLVTNGTGGEDQYRRVIEDTVLPPSAKVVWLVLAGQGRSMRPFPALPAIQQLANIQSASTFSGSLEILRINRWLTVSQPGDPAMVRVVMLHSPPLPSQDVLAIDRGHVAYLDRLRLHDQRRIRTLVADALWELQPDQRDHGDTAKERWIFARSRRIGPRAAPGQLELAFGVVAARDSQGDPRRTASESASLIYPSRWTPEQVRLANRYLSMVSSSLRQAVLDELEGRVGAVSRGAAPVYDELRFLKRLCEAARAGTFEPNLGGPVRREREQEQQRRLAHRPNAAGRKEDARNAAAAARAFEQIWASLGDTPDSTG